MNSLEIIKQELINQKNLLDEKGFVVTTTYTNPSPTEITNAIEKINFNFTSTTATEEDVRAGKTFYSKTNELKTGTFDLSIIDTLNDKLTCFISGSGSLEIILPEKTTRIRSCAYFNETTTPSLFYKKDLTILPNITEIGDKAFYNCKGLTGLLIVPSTCESLGKECFYGTGIEEAVVYSGISTGSTYIFSLCESLKKVTIEQNITRFPTYAFRSCTALEEIVLPSALKEFRSSDISLSTKIKQIKFRGTTACYVDATCFSGCPTATLLVPYESFDSYYNKTNFLAYGNPMCGFGDFEQGATLPSEAPGYTIIWYQTLDDLKAGTNPITECPTTGTMYASFTEIETEE